MDVSIYKQVREALHKGNDNLIEFIDALPQMAWIANPNGKITYFNSSWYHYTGMKQGQTDGWVNVLHPEDSSQIISAWHTSLGTGDYHMECRIRNYSDGSYRWFLEQAMPIRDDTGTIIIWFGTYTDVDDEKKDLEP